MAGVCPPRGARLQVLIHMVIHSGPGGHLERMPGRSDKIRCSTIAACLNSAPRHHHPLVTWCSNPVGDAGQRLNNLPGRATGSGWGAQFKNEPASGISIPFEPLRRSQVSGSKQKEMRSSRPVSISPRGTSRARALCSMGSPHHGVSEPDPRLARSSSSWSRTSGIAPVDPVSTASFEG